MPILKTKTWRGHKWIFPLFLPDATRGVVRSVDMQDLKKIGLEALMLNSFHLAQNPGRELIKNQGGIKNFIAWDGGISTDSGGFQVLSLLKQKNIQGKIEDEGLVIYQGNQRHRKWIFSPEDSIRTQWELGSDLLICLDDFTPPEADEKKAQETVRRTVLWAQRSYNEFQRLIEENQTPPAQRPLLIAVIQGGFFFKLRRQCAEQLQELNFDGFGFGGWPVLDGKFATELSDFNAQLTPDDKLRFALGIGKPQDIVQGWEQGYHLFDCVLPTRDARHQRLYLWRENPAEITLAQLKEGSFYEYLYLKRRRYQEEKPISSYCSCHTCNHYSRAFLQHLFRINETLAYRLATIHNLSFYQQLIDRLRELQTSVSQKAAL